MMKRTIGMGALFLSLLAVGACTGAPEDPTDSSEEGDVAADGEALSLPDKCNLGPVFTHVVDAGNINPSAGWSTAIDNPAFNGNPKAVLIVTPNWTPIPFGAEVRNYHPVGVWFDDATGFWNVYNDDAAPMPAGTGFNVRLANGFVRRSPVPATGSPSFDVVEMSHAAHLFVTPSFNPGGGPTGLNNWSPLAVTATGCAVETWRLDHADGVAFDAGVAYNLVDLTCATVHTVDAANLTTVADSKLPGLEAFDRKAVFFATNRGFLGANPTQWARQLAVRWDKSKQQWLVHSWDLYVESMPIGSQMNVVGQPPMP